LSIFYIATLQPHNSRTHFHLSSDLTNATFAVISSAQRIWLVKQRQI